MAKLKVYISSTFLDLEEPRKLIIDRVQKGLSPYFELTNIMEDMSGDAANRADVDICLAEVRKADVYIILMGKRYGAHPEKFNNEKGVVQENINGLSFTELEYDAACETLSEKFYGIYKFELTDDFFTSEELESKTDLDDPKKKESFTLFSEKLKETVSPIEINNGAELVIGINNKLTEFDLNSRIKEDLDLCDSDYNSIDRKPQINTVKSLQAKDADKAGAYIFLVGLENKDDCPHEFTLQLYTELTGADPEMKKMDYIRSDSITSVTAENNPDKTLKVLLGNCYKFIRGQIANNASFEMLLNDLRTKDIQNVFIGFEVYRKINMAFEEAGFLKTIAAFVTKINEVMLNASFGYNFYFVVYIYSESESQQELPQKLPDEYILPFKDLKCIPVGSLTKIKDVDAKEWIEKIKVNKDSINIKNENTDSLFRLVFYGPDRFPAKYQTCIELIKNRTK